MHRSRLRSLVLLAAVLLGQWLSFAHAYEHPQLKPAHASCAYCVSGVGTGVAPGADSFEVAVTAAAELAQSRYVAFIGPVAAGPRLSQGPPTVF